MQAYAGSWCNGLNVVLGLGHLCGTPAEAGRRPAAAIASNIRQWFAIATPITLPAHTLSARTRSNPRKRAGKRRRTWRRSPLRCSWRAAGRTFLRLPDTPRRAPLLSTPDQGWRVRLLSSARAAATSIPLASIRSSSCVWRSGVFVLFGVRVDCLQVEVLRFDLGARDRPTARAVFTPGQALEEVIEVGDGQRRFLADLDVRQIVVPDLLGGAAAW